MKQKSQLSSLYIVGSAVLVVIAIAITSILNRPTTSQNEDIRAVAGTRSTPTATATVASVSETGGFITVDNFRFMDDFTTSLKTMGSWKVIVPLSFSVQSVGPGTQITVSIDPKTLDIGARSVSAIEITVR